MTPEELKKNFEEQLKSADAQIVELEANLAKAKEYKTKLVGGLETLNLLNPPQEEEKEEAPSAE